MKQPSFHGKKFGLFTTQTQPIFEVMDVPTKHPHPPSVSIVCIASEILRRLKDRLGGLAGAKDLAIQHQVDLPQVANPTQPAMNSDTVIPSEIQFIYPCKVSATTCVVFKKIQPIQVFGGEKTKTYGS